MTSTTSTSSSSFIDVDGFRSDVLSVDTIRDVLKKTEANPDRMELRGCQILAGTSRGDNYVGDVAEVRAMVAWRPLEQQPEEIPGELQSSSEEKFIRWMVKLLKPLVNGGPDFARTLGVHAREGKMYTRIIPEMVKLGGRHAPRFCNYVAKSDVEGQEFLALEHMGELGYESAFNKSLGLDFAHCERVMNWLASFHALGYVMIQKYPGGKKSFLADHPWLVPLSQRMPDDLESMAESAKESNMENFLLIASLIQEDNPGGQDYVGAVDRLGARMSQRVDRLKEASEKEKEPFSTICHLDPWFNNMLFRYGGESSGDDPEDVILLDFQSSGYCHPGNDLAHFFLNSTTGDFRRRHLLDLLRIYYDQLQKVAALSGVKDLSHYTFEELSRDYGDGLSVGMTFCVLALPTILAKPEDTVDLGEIDMTDPEGLKKFSSAEKERIKRAMKDNDVMKERIKDAFDDMIQVGIM